MASASVGASLSTARLSVSSTYLFSAMDLRSTGRGFDYRPPIYRAATLGKSFTQHLWSCGRMAL